MFTSSMTTAVEPSQRRRTALEMVRSFEDWNIPSIMKHRSSKCIHQVLPCTNVTFNISIYPNSIQYLSIGHQ
jgi:hypothetical protein